MLRRLLEQSKKASGRPLEFSRRLGQFQFPLRFFSPLRVLRPLRGLASPKTPTTQRHKGIETLSIISRSGETIARCNLAIMKNQKSENPLTLKLKGKACVFVDWANVHGWAESLKKEVDPAKLYRYLGSYKEIKQTHFYFGTDKHPKSKAFLSKIKRVGYQVTTKPVKYIAVAEVDGEKILKRKCDFDMEICIDVHRLLNEGFESYIFFTGDGDFEPLYKLLIGRRKQVIVIYAHGHLGREIWEVRRGVFKKAIDRLGVDLF